MTAHERLIVNKCCRLSSDQIQHNIKDSAGIFLSMNVFQDLCQPFLLRNMLKNRIRSNSQRIRQNRRIRQNCSHCNDVGIIQIKILIRPH